MAKRAGMAKRKVSNPLALGLLTLLVERPMHPYEMAATLRERGKQHSVRLNYGSLYTVVDALQRAGFVVPQETAREGRRPERTVYEITAAGRDEVVDWLRELLGQPAKEYPQFTAGLTFMPLLPPAEALAVLKDRERLLAKQVETARLQFTGLLEGSAEIPGLPAGMTRLPRLFLIESEYELAMHEAELHWLRQLVRDLEDGSFDGLELWHGFHRQGGEGPGMP